MKENSYRKRWWIFIQERFRLPAHLSMVLVFVLGNIVFSELPETKFEVLSQKGIAIFMVALSFFFRLRLFDEIKDLDTDKKVNPGRPLARGLLQVRDLSRALGILVIFEAALVWGFFPTATAYYLLALLYSYLMYREFFMGSLLRPHLTTYAVTHTFVSVLIGFTIGASFRSGANPWKLSHAWVFLSNWCFFNLFEFARKTFSPQEERSTVESYSKIFGISGAVGLSITQLVFGIGLISFYLPHLRFDGYGGFLLACVLVALVPGLVFSFKKTLFSAKLFRTACSMNLIVVYLSLYIYQKLLS